MLRLPARGSLVPYVYRQADSATRYLRAQLKIQLLYGVQSTASNFVMWRPYYTAPLLSISHSGEVMGGLAIGLVFCQSDPPWHVAAGIRILGQRKGQAITAEARRKGSLVVAESIQVRYILRKALHQS